MKKLYTILLFTIFLFTACIKEDEEIDFYPVTQDLILRDVSYGSHPQQKMDVYLPAGRNQHKTKFIVYIHGGGWSSGDKDDFPLNDEIVMALKENFPDFALFNLNYRLVEEEEFQYPAAEEDIKSAMDYIYNSLQSYQLSGKSYISGGSAGAHLAALYTLKHHTGIPLQGCIVVSGAFNMVSLYEQGNEQVKQYVSAFLGGTPEQKPDQYFNASPINFITPQVPRFLILHGKEDDLTPIGQANELITALQVNRIDYRAFTYPGGHGVPSEHIMEAFDYIKDFLQ